MLKRKIEKYLGQWKEAADRKPLVIKGIRQCGKTCIQWNNRLFNESVTHFQNLQYGYYEVIVSVSLFL